MFNSEFFPTPQHVIQMMIGTTDLNGKHVLEPSAGKGDIVDYCAGHGAFVTACEKNPELAKIVASKSRFLKHDFLDVTADEVSHIDYIVMNPPFSNADKHILHAWELAPDGCEVIALCNWETVNNRFTAARSRLGRIISDYGHSTNIGIVFSQAERTTGIDIGLIHLFKPASTNSFEGYFDESEDEAEQQFNGIMPHNSIREAVQRYVGACQLFDEVAQNAVKMNYLVGEFGLRDLAFSLKENEKDSAIEEFKKKLQKNAWTWVFNKMNMEKYLTESLKKEINVFVEKQTKVPFTMKNIYKMMEIVVGTHGSRMERALVEIFDKLTMHHAENRYNVEGWKTNSHYLVNQRFILEYVATAEWGKCRVIYGRGNAGKVDDLTKALCWLTGKNYADYPTLYSFYQMEDKEWGMWYEWGFFKVRVYKKGTLHAQFLDKKVWELFNRAVAKAKGYPLPESVKL
jgi:ribosomal protein L10